MKLGIISDSHDNLPAIEKAIEFFKKENVDAIIHLGDYIAPFSLREFGGFELYGVWGNNDGEREMLRKVAQEMGFIIEEPPFELEIGKKIFLLLHGWGNVKRTVRVVDSLAKSGEYNWVLYGHTHRMDVRKIGDTWILNPGEVCGYLTSKSTVAILNLETDEVRVVEL